LNAAVAAGNVPVFGILKRGGKVYTKMIADASSKTLLKALKSKVLLDSIVYTDSFGSYDVLDVSGFKPRRVNHSKTFVSPQL
jgi:transposase